MPPRSDGRRRRQQKAVPYYYRRTFRESPAPASVVTPAPELAVGVGLRSCSIGILHSAVVAGDRGSTVRQSGENGLGKFWIGGLGARRGFVPAAPGLRGATVCCGEQFTVALTAAGAVHAWGCLPWCGAIHPHPVHVEDLPPIAMVGAGDKFMIAISTADEAYCWGCHWVYQHALGIRGSRARPTRVAPLSGRDVRNVACGSMFVAAETGSGLLLRWGGRGGDAFQPGLLDAAEPGPAFPLRSLAAGGQHVALADAAGEVWLMPNSQSTVISRVALPLGVRAVRVAATQWQDSAVALAEDGSLWDCSDPDHWQPHSISAAHPELPLGLVPHGGCGAGRFWLVPDHCCRKWQVRLLVKIAVRLGLPSGPVRDVMVPFLLHEDYITGPTSDPFGRPHGNIAEA